MKPFLIAMAIAVFPFSAHSQIVMQKQVVCDKPIVVMRALEKDFGEVPIWASQTDDKTSIILVVNKDKETWTMIEMNSELACVLSSGKGLPVTT
jgi:hypothetical protein